MSVVFQHLIPIMYQCTEQHERVLTHGDTHSKYRQAPQQLDIHTTPYIDPKIIRAADTKQGSWKLRQPIFSDVPKTKRDIIDAITRNFDHPYYKRVAAIDREKKLVYKLYSVEHRRNYAIQQQGDRWGDMISELCERAPVCKIINWLPNIRENLHGAIFEYVPGDTIDNIYCETGKKWDDGHPDVVAGRLEPYWGTVSCVGSEHHMFIKRKIINMFMDICLSCQHVDLTSWNYQQTENEPEWSDRWDFTDTRRILNVDDWRLQNIIESTDGSWKFVKLDRTVMTDPTNAIKRFIADLRSQTNITVKEHENTLV